MLKYATYMGYRKRIFLVLIIIALLVGVPSLSEAALFNGYDWGKIGSLPCFGFEKRQIKVTFLKLAYETALFQNGQTIFPEDLPGNKFLSLYGNKLRPYLNIIDRFYLIEENKKFPLFCAFMIAVKIESGASPALVESYKLSVREQLKKRGLIQ